MFNPALAMAHYYIQIYYHRRSSILRVKQRIVQIRGSIVSVRALLRPRGRSAVRGRDWPVGGRGSYHDVHVQPVGAKAEHALGLRGEVGEVRREHRRRYLRGSHGCLRLGSGGSPVVVVEVGTDQGRRCFVEFGSGRGIGGSRSPRASR
jgi:hypothetical protein